MENLSVEVEELDGCMCQYIPENLREQIALLERDGERYTSEVATLALQIGLAVLLDGSFSSELQDLAPRSGKMKQRKIKRGKLAGAGV
jgi:hypothetical protein